MKTAPQNYLNIGIKEPGRMLVEEINCDICGDFVCIAHTNDLEGSYFYCALCVTKARDQSL